MNEVKLPSMVCYPGNRMVSLVRIWVYMIVVTHGFWFLLLMIFFDLFRFEKRISSGISLRRFENFDDFSTGRYFIETIFQLA